VIPPMVFTSMRKHLWIGYAVLANVGTAGLFYYDKQQAIQGGWRVRESTLQMTALIGGWVGGYIAIQKFKHKRSKPSFLVWYHAATAANLVLIGAALVVYKRPLMLHHWQRLRAKVYPQQWNQHVEQPPIAQQSSRETMHRVTQKWNSRRNKKLHR